MRANLAGSARRVLIDASAYFALGDPRDRNHVPARFVARRIINEQLRTYTTNFVVAEAHALHVTRIGRGVGLRFLEGLARGETIVVRVSTSDERRAVQIIRQYDDKDFSITDAMSFAVMERLRIGWAFSFDRDFSQYGFPLLSPT
ncbi:MAG: type II toxin-antitoxin system VapC family toxin [Chloroflexi bacterium]|nr:type II toxin-antitoxin system VapC family toxin [Chloroflexota bacterium]